METLSDEIVLLVIDKLLIAVIIIIVGYFVNKTLETYKSRNSLVNDITKLRIDKISELTYKVAEFEQVIYEVKFKGLEIHMKKLLIEDFRARTDADLQKDEVMHNSRLVQELEKLYDTTKTRIESEILGIKNEIEELEQKRDNVFSDLKLIQSQYRFWLGAKLADKLNTLLNDLIDSIKNEFKEPDDILEYEKQLDEIDKKRIDVFKLIENVET